MNLRPMTEADLPRVSSAWNATLTYDQFTEQRFGQITLGDPNYEPEGMPLAESDTGDILGFSACVLRREVVGKDGGGSQDGFDHAYLKGFFVVPGEAGHDVGAKLIAAAESYARSANKRWLVLSEYDVSYAYPGLDVRYERLRDLLMQNGFQDTYTIECVAADLHALDLPRMLEETWATMPADVKLATWDPSMLPAMRNFVTEGEMPGWFPIGWEEHYQRRVDHRLILTKADEIVAWAQFGSQKPTAGFGPILVLPRLRGKNYGGLLLLEAMLRARAAGSDHMLAQWANTGFYIRYGWSIVRRFAVLRKDLTQQKGDSR